MKKTIPTKAFSWLYFIFFPSVYIAARIFYRRWSIHGLKNFPQHGEPAIIVSNHQNGLMDPLICCLSSPRQLHFLTRADVFKNPLIRAINLRFNMMPVYRMHDKVDDMRGLNDLTFDASIEKLKNGAVIALFPEGNHGNKKFLRPMKKGVARLAFSALDRYEELENLKIIPMGLEYSGYEKFRSELDVTIDEPFTIKELKEQYKGQEVKGINELTKLIGERLKRVVVDLKPKEHYEMLRDAHSFVKKFEKHYMPTKLKMDTVSQLVLNDENSGNAATEIWSKVKTSLNQHETSYSQVAEAMAGNKLRPKIWSFFGWPLLIISSLTHILPYITVNFLVKKMVKDPHFTSTFKMSFGWILYPIYWIILFVILNAFFSLFLSLILILGVIFLGWMALEVKDALTDWRNQIKGNKWIKSHPKEYKEIKNWLALLGINKENNG